MPFNIIQRFSPELLLPIRISENYSRISVQLSHLRQSNMPCDDGQEKTREIFKPGILASGLPRDQNSVYSCMEKTGRAFPCTKGGANNRPSMAGCSREGEKGRGGKRRSDSGLSILYFLRISARLYGKITFHFCR